MIKSFSRSTGLSSLCLIVVLVVPLIQCLPFEHENNSINRSKRNLEKASASSQASIVSGILPISKEQFQKYGSWPPSFGGNGFSSNNDNDGLFGGLFSNIGKTVPLLGSLTGGVKSFALKPTNGFLSETSNGLLSHLGLEKLNPTISGAFNDLLSGGDFKSLLRDGNAEKLLAWDKILNSKPLPNPQSKPGSAY